MILAVNSQDSRVLVFFKFFSKSVYAILLAGVLASCNQQTESKLFKISGQTMGTYYRVSIVSIDDVEITQTQALIEDSLKQVNAQMSTYLDDSEITRFNKSNSTDWFTVSKDFALVADKAKELYQQSQGRFDTTLGPLIELWSFGADQRPIKAPTQSQQIEALKIIGSDKLDVRLDPPALNKSVSNLTLDLSAIAKGFAVDKLALLLESNNHNDFLIDIGGELRSKGSNLEGQKWRVGIEQPDPTHQQSVQQIVSFTDKSIATSGSYRNFFEQDGTRFSHIIDPETGSPITHQLVSASVIADDCMSADGYATMLMVLGPELGFEFALQYGLAVYMIEMKGDEVVVKTTPQMQPFME